MVVDPRWALPVSHDVIALAARASRVVVIEDNVVTNGIGMAITSALHAAGVETPVTTYGIPKEFLAHASRGQVMETVGLTPDPIVTDLLPKLA